ncbi:sensor histidine kinase [Janibacter limosus]|uniref:histidine kinase n=1 Tax=Janibacter limosus TaxID=53458 RepID=A0A4P6MN60_9MICO|nr:sensor histidine kinase [Janibacter limosus]QBF44891.1 sensor histidine kinase [Janibacter limosus]
MAWSDRVGGFFALDDDWERPGGTISRGDALFTLTVVALSLFVLELMRALGSLVEVDRPIWQQWLLTAIPALFLLTRRRYPLLTAAAASLAYWAISSYEPLMASLLSTQVSYFLVVLGGVAWARNRRTMAGVYGVILFAMFLWLVWGFAVGQATTGMVGSPDPEAWIAPTIAAPVMLSIINILYFGGAVIGGQAAWRSARQRAGLRTQTETIREQTGQLREAAVVEERLRIARELHDVVAHHVSGIGVQAAAARRVLDKDPEAAKGALLRIEGGSRDAVTQMRGLLGTLRMGEAPAPDTDHAPEPTLADVVGLVAERDGTALTVTHEVVEDSPGDLDAVPTAIGHSLYRTAQEALTNVVRHSSAQRARVTVRVGDRHAEVEVTDDGRPLPGSSGSGMGQLGIRERVSSHHGTVEIGPRPLGGYRVRARIPLRSEES